MTLKNRLLKHIALTFILFCGTLATTAQMQSNPLEKIYTQTDRPFYFPGETLWFKSYVVDENNRPSHTSDLIIAELISPKGTVVKQKKLATSFGYAHGDFTIQKDWVGGIYRLKVYTHYMRNFGKTSFFTKEITVQKVVVPKLLLSLDYQKETYGKGSVVHADFKVENLKNQPLANTSFVAKVRLRGYLIMEKELRTDEAGESVVTFQLPKDLNTSDVVLNIEVPYQGSQESISRTVPVLMDNIDLQFLPEGGKIIKGATNTIAFKALNEFGKPADVSGIIWDAEGNKIQEFESTHDGMGAFDLKPGSGMAYKAQITHPFMSDSLYQLPHVHTSGAKISLLEHTSKNTGWEFHTAAPFQGTFQALDALGRVCFEKNISFRPGSHKIKVPISQFPRGITKFRVLTEQKHVVSERLVFLNNHKALKIEIKPDKEVYGPREKVVLEILTKDFDQNPISSNLAISVSDNALLSFADDKQDRIDSHFLLSSELKGKIHEPSFYFDPEEKNTEEARDLVMLTHGWRDYLQQPKKKLDFFPEKRNLLEGQVLDKKGNPIEAHLILFDRFGDKALQFKTDAHGNYRCKLGKARSYVLVAYREDKQFLKIVERQTPTTLTAPIPANNGVLKKANEKTTGFAAVDGTKKPLQEPIKEAAAFSINMEEDAQSLDEVVVTALGTTISKQSLGYAVAEADAEELGGSSDTISQLLQGRVAGVQITNSSGVNGAGTTVNIRGLGSVRGSSRPLYVIDGIPYSDGFSDDQNTELQNLNPSDIQNISVLKGVAASSLYGSAGLNGVVLINTKKGRYRYNDKILSKKKFNNYAVKYIFKYNRPNSVSSTKEFYMPVYDAGEMVTERNDFRKTIYWNPVVQTDKNGKAQLEFYNSDAITSFNITAEGMSYNGLVNHQEVTYSIQRPLSISTKLPRYSVLNDTIKIPVTITNNTSQIQKLQFDVTLPKEFQLLDKKELGDSIQVDANGFLLKHIAVVPKKTGKNLAFTANVHNGLHSDGFSEDITVLSPYFPTETTISGSENGTYSFVMDHVVAGSVQADFKVYVDVIGDVMNGIEGIIRKPYGCFEQTSASTYPNVMVLKYLQETGKSNQEIEAKAMNYIKQGYKRLIGFETSEGGFEWFGKTPPHETLTAFGILEFTEMKEVYPKVDQKMIHRTVQWLLGQKDGKGGFHKSKKGYDSFASSPPKVANAYIVYALSEAGLSTEIEAEFQSALQEALRSKDVYRMALMALASDNLGNTSAYAELMKELLQKIEKLGYENQKVENTITRSYGNSKALETTALIVLALLRDDAHSDKVAKGVQFITSHREHGRFGSTQATVMSLKALLEYSKSQKRALLGKDDSIAIMVNGKTFMKNLQQLDNGTLLIPNIGEYLVEGVQKVEVKFKNDKKTSPYALDVKWDSYLPNSSTLSPVVLKTELSGPDTSVGSLVRMGIHVSNKLNEPVSMTTAIIGIPSGAGLQPYQLKELLETNLVDYYEVFDNYLVLYWKSMTALEEKVIHLDLKAEIPGRFQAPASAAYLYYGDENKYWVPGTSVHIRATVGN
nr:TonB-dependent receptor plug domain-containing protein [Allomuricauda sp.]